ncbi:PadR family transcriptional regulator [Paenibacillus humicus]|uniref:PadR family transcriptional regulator n=1 Tax=Paenibacillus humicus TaxID=412861 RepID=UPI003F167A9D
MRDRSRSREGHSFRSARRHGLDPGRGHGPGRQDGGRGGRGGRGGGGDGGGRMFHRGQLKYAVLQLLSREPMHGYQLMKTMEEESGGSYIPSAGSVYPVLQKLEHKGLISSEASTDSRRSYRITEEGREDLAEHRRRMGADADAGKPSWQDWRKSHAQRMKEIYHRSLAAAEEYGGEKGPDLSLLDWNSMIQYGVELMAQKPSSPEETGNTTPLADAYAALKAWLDGLEQDGEDDVQPGEAEAAGK